MLRISVLESILLTFVEESKKNHAYVKISCSKLVLMKPQTVVPMSKSTNAVAHFVSIGGGVKVNDMLVELP